MVFSRTKHAHVAQQGQLPAPHGDKDYTGSMMMIRDDPQTRKISLCPVDQAFAINPNLCPYYWASVD